MMRSPQGGKGQAEGCYVPSLGKWPRRWTSRGPKAAFGEGSPGASEGWPLERTWPTARAVALLCADLTQSSETGTVQRLPRHNLPREG